MVTPETYVQGEATYKLIDVLWPLLGQDRLNGPSNLQR